MNPIRRLILRVRAFLWTAFAMVCIGAGLLVGIANLLLPYADRYRDEVAEVLSERVGKPVSLERLDGEWATFGPRFSLRGLVLGNPGDASYLRVELASVSLDLFGWLRPGNQGLQQLRVAVDEIEIVRRTDGSWGLGGDQSGPTTVRSDAMSMDWLRGDLVAGFTANSIRITDERAGLTATLPGGELNIENHGDHSHLAGRFGDRSTGVIRAVVEHSIDSDHVRLYVEGSELDLPAWSDGLFRDVAVTDGRSRFQLWFDLTAGELQGDFETTDLELQANDDNAVQGTYRLDAAAGDLSGWIQPDDAGVLVSNLAIARGSNRWLAPRLGVAQQADRFRIEARGVEIHDLLDAAVLLPAIPDRWRQTLAMASARGSLDELDLAIEHAPGEIPDVRGHMILSAASWEPVGQIPGASSVRVEANISGATATGEVALDGGQVRMPRIFRNALDPVELTMGWKADWGTAQPELSFSTSELRNAGVAAEVRGLARFNGGRPFIELSANVLEADVAVAHRYLPINVTPPAVVQWLDRALIGGRLEAGQVALFGDLDDWPFRNNEGRFTARATVADGRLDYRDQWPPLEGYSATIEFDPFGMRGRVHAATLAGMAVGESDVDITRFKDPVVQIAAQGRSDGEVALAFLRDIPLAGEYRTYLEGLSVEAESDLWVNLDVPLTPRLGTTTITGHAWLDNARVVDDKWDVTFSNATGRLDFSGDGIEAVDVATEFRGTPAQLTLRTGGFVDDPANGAEATLAGASSPQVLLADLAALAPLLPHVVGTAPWTVGVRIPKDGSGPELRVDCQLDGSDLDLPAPIGGDAERTVQLSLNLRDPLQKLELTLGNVGTLSARRPGKDKPWSAYLALGDTVPREPAEPGLTVAGNLPSIDLDAWIGIAARITDPGQLGGDQETILNRLDLEVSALRMAGRDFDAVRIEARRDSGYWTIALEGPAVAGRLRLPTTLTDNRLLLAEFERLDWPEAPEGAAPLKAEFDPRILPPMDFFANALSFGGNSLGVVRFESFPTQSGMKIENFTTESPELRIAAAGDWFSDSHSAFSVTITSPDLGGALEDFGFTGIIEGGQLLAQLSAEWDGSPSDFELQRLDGGLQLDVRRGLISEVEPGAGRIFGLLSVQTLPRRLLLDFSDLFSSGLAFDSITGEFELNQGEAHTSDLIVEGPTADVLIQGRTGLAQRDYDQTVTVVPKVGGSLPLVGALAGGPVGAAALLILQGVLGDQIDDLTRYQYAVSGPWSDPAIERLDQRGGNPAGDAADQSGD